MIADATPWYEDAAEALSKRDPPFVITKLDTTYNKELAEKYGIQGFSTLFYF